MAWEYSSKEFIKIYRRMMDWEWYTDVNTTKLFLHCLLRANWKSGRWQGINYDEGEFITSLPSLAEESGLTIKQVRTSLTKLIETGELASRTADNRTGKKLSKNRIITIKKWGDYQSKGRQTDSQEGSQMGREAAGKGQAEGREAAADIRSIEINKNKKEGKKEPPAVCPSGLFDDVSDEELEQMAEGINRKVRDDDDLRILRG